MLKILLGLSLASVLVSCSKSEILQSGLGSSSAIEKSSQTPNSMSVSGSLTLPPGVRPPIEVDSLTGSPKTTLDAQARIVEYSGPRSD